MNPPVDSKDASSKGTHLYTALVKIQINPFSPPFLKTSPVKSTPVTSNTAEPRTRFMRNGEVSHSMPFALCLL